MIVGSRHDKIVSSGEVGRLPHAQLIERLPEQVGGDAKDEQKHRNFGAESYLTHFSLHRIC
jgi:hypothetical protein